MTNPAETTAAAVPSLDGQRIRVLVINSAVSPPPFASSRKMRPNTPNSLQRMKRL